MFRLLKVSGNSLTPEYRNGDYILVTRLFRRLKENDVVVFVKDTYGMMVKRVRLVSANQSEYFVEGTHPDSIDSRCFGFVSRQDVIGKVLWHIAPRMHTDNTDDSALLI